MDRIWHSTGFRVMTVAIILLFQLHPLSCQDAVTDSLIDENLRDIQMRVRQDISGAQRWWYGWLAGYSAATVGQGIVCFTTENRTTRQDMAVGAATTFLGAVGQLLTPMLTNESSSEHTDYISGEQPLPSDYSLELLKALALREKEGRSWKVHAIAGVVNIGSGLITWLGFKRTVWDGLENFALNTIITEAQIWTQPTRAIRDYQNYCSKYDQAACRGAIKPASEWNVSMYPGGIALKVDF